jgi:predicted transcriptional regulator
MTKHDLKAVLDRVLAWPADRQEEAAEILLALEAREGEYYQPTPGELAAINEGLRELDRGEFASEEEVNLLLRQPWTK